VPNHKEWIEFLAAVFGSMAFFRSSLFTMKVGEADVAVGPGIFFQVLLHATDRACDRGRAEPRSVLAKSIMSGVLFKQARDALPSFCFELMQNVPADEQQQFRQAVDALSSADMLDSVIAEAEPLKSNSTMDNSTKMTLLGLSLQRQVGDAVLLAALVQFADGIHRQPPLAGDVVVPLHP
jgi:hypothetical protein